MNIDTETLKASDRVWLRLELIVTDAGTQVRAKIDEDTVSQYAAEMTEGAKFPPVVVFHDGNRFILADGFHRVMAASRNEFRDIEADIFKGTKSDALKYALKANSTHGLKRTNADKRRSVEMALSEWPNLSTAELSRICAVSRPQVDAVRNESQHAESACSPRQGADGKTRKMPTPKPSMPTPAQAAALFANVWTVEPSFSKPATVAESGTASQALNGLDGKCSASGAGKPIAYPVAQCLDDLQGIVDNALTDYTLEDLRKVDTQLDIMKRRIASRIAALKTATLNP